MHTQLDNLETCTMTNQPGYLPPSALCMKPIWSVYRST